MPWLRLIRWKNLLIIFLTQLLAWWCVLLPHRPGMLNSVHFILLACSTMLIAAAGYIINDYFDIKIDAINRPERMVLEKVIPRKQAIVAHLALNVIALVLAGYVAVGAGHPEWLLLQVACTGVLWFYSTHFKRQYVVGNVVVAALSALTIIALVIYEPALRGDGRSDAFIKGVILLQPEWVLLFYAYFAFMLSWMREIVKDMEDIKGDAENGCATMPVKSGLRFSRNFTMVLGGVMTGCLAAGVGWLYHYHFALLAGYVAFVLLVVMVWSAFFFAWPSVAAHYHKASGLLKIIMLIGVCSLVVYHFQLS